MLVLVDYDAGNLRSISKAFEKIGVTPKISGEAADILAADGLILPGVGAFPKAMKTLEEKGLIEPIKTAVKNGTPLLGVCLGMQLLFEQSYEHGQTKGLALIPGEVKPLPVLPNLAVPHMGWNRLDIQQDDPFVASLADAFVYYVHSYYVDCPKEYILATSHYGVEVPGIVRKGHVYGTQFHPEKSSAIGQEILKAFVKGIQS